MLLIEEANLLPVENRRSEISCQNGVKRINSDDGSQECLVPLVLPEDPSTGRWFKADYACSSDDDGPCDQFPTYPIERWKTAVSIALMFCCTCFNGAVAALITDLVPRTPMDDVVFRFLPEQKWAWQVSDGLAMLLSVTHLCLVLCHKHRWIMIRRFCAISSQLYLLRGVCMGVTWMAVPGKYHASRCVQPASMDEYWSTVARRVSRFMLSAGLSAGNNGEEILCGDLLYSGHTLVLVLTWYSVDMHAPLLKCRPLRLFAGVAACLGMLMIVACRMHYTVDVLLAFMLTTVYFFSYYAYLSLKGPKRRFWRQYAQLAFWLLPLVEYFETNVPPHKMPRKLEWPFNRPQVVKQFVKQLN